MGYTLVYNDLVTGRKELGLLLYPTQDFAQKIANTANQTPVSPDTYYTVAPYGA